METINKNSYLIIMYFLIRSLVLGSTLNGLYSIASQDAWISVIVSLIIGFIPLIIYYLILNYNSKLNINEVIDENFNKILSNILKVIFILFFIFHISINIWILANFVSSQYLFKTPILIVLIILIYPIIHIANKKLFVIGRTATIFFTIELFLFITAALFLIFKIDFSNLLPIFEFGPKPIFSAAINLVSYTILPTFCLLIIPKDNIKFNQNLLSSIIRTYLLTYITIFIVVFLILAIFGIKLTLFYEFPEFHVLKLINIGNFVQRIETFLSFQWFFDIFIANAMFFYYIKSSVRQTLKLKKNIDKYLIFIIAIISIIIAKFVFSNNTIAYVFLNNFYKYIVIFCLFIIPLIILIKCKFKKN